MPRIKYGRCYGYIRIINSGWSEKLFIRIILASCVCNSTLSELPPTRNFPETLLT